ncbi:hypothetical protein GCM10010123_44220 [Pilimelia anulata]|uniref:Uncharacterized protein n=1 Tax=Pilimelia anulata TaxID=53371 RepID=A0A8J3BH80_9ACTN|nr:hypothetical protein [Pilimelia anulata]GGK09489.1 hypothetical protein GCM10010123_44220 [Pilimelia anulata]
MAAGTTLVRLACAAVELRSGDEVRTPSRRWERVVTVARSGRQVRVVTDGTGPDFPWLWIVGHRLPVRRRMAGAAPGLVAA